MPFTQTLYICPVCRAVEFSITALTGEQECCECSTVMREYPVATMDDLLVVRADQGGDNHAE